MNPCTTCRFYKNGGWFSVRGDICTNSKCDDPGFTFIDPVTGEVRKYERHNDDCYSARVKVCIDGKYWEEKGGR